MEETVLGKLSSNI